MGGLNDRRNCRDVLLRITIGIRGRGNDSRIGVISVAILYPRRR
jgi:hypothetical protein